MPNVQNIWGLIYQSVCVGVLKWCNRKAFGEILRLNPDSRLGGQESEQIEHGLIAVLCDTQANRGCLVRSCMRKKGGQRLAQSVIQPGDAD